MANKYSLHFSLVPMVLLIPSLLPWRSMELPFGHPLIATPGIMGRLSMRLWARVIFSPSATLVARCACWIPSGCLPSRWTIVPLYMPIRRRTIGQSFKWMVCPHIPKNMTTQLWIEMPAGLTYLRWKRYLPFWSVILPFFKTLMSSRQSMILVIMLFGVPFW